MYYNLNNQLYTIHDNYTVHMNGNKDFDLTKNGETNLFFIALDGNENTIPQINS